MPQRRHAQSGLEIAARLGYAARGLVYVIVGGFALLAAFEGRRPVDTKGALVSLLQQPLGTALLAFVAAGLLCFAAWRLMQAFLDADHEGNSREALGRRAAYAFSALVYLGLSASAVGLIFQWAARDGDQQTRDWTAWLMRQPMGDWLVIAVGVAVVAGGIAIGVKGIKGTFERRLELHGEARDVMLQVGRYGHLARAAVFVMIGVFLIAAAVHANSREAVGLGGSLRLLQQQPYGWILLAVTAAGFVAFGLFEIAQSAYRRVTPPNMREIAARAKL
jgi:uncharacterized protein DUF1206